MLKAQEQKLIGSRGWGIGVAEDEHGCPGEATIVR